MISTNAVPEMCMYEADSKKITTGRKHNGNCRLKRTLQHKSALPMSERGFIHHFQASAKHLNISFAE
jgi:hypothetical protein